MPRRTPEYVFLREYEKLSLTIENVSENGLSDLALILRKLLLDGFYQRAARRFKFKPVFTVTDFDERGFQKMVKIIRGTGHFIVGMGDLLYPKNASQFKKKELFWKDFLKYTLGNTDDFTITVKDLIRFEAHVQGSVHHKEPEEGLEEAMDKNSFFVGNLPITLRQLRSVALVTLDALAPLYKLINDESA